MFSFFSRLPPRETITRSRQGRGVRVRLAARQLACLAGRSVSHSVRRVRSEVFYQDGGFWVTFIAFVRRSHRTVVMYVMGGGDGS